MGESIAAVKRIIRVLGGIAVVAMLVNVVLEVASRNLANNPIPGTHEYVTYWYMATISFVGMWLAQDSGEQIYVTILTDRMSGPTYALFGTAGSLFSAGFLLLLAWHSWDAALHYQTIGEYIGANRVPIWPARFLVPFSSVALAGSILIGTFVEMRARLERTNVPSMSPDFEGPRGGL